MPSVCRRIVVLLVVALLGAGGVGSTVTAAHAQQGAGDQQYEDPFGGTGSGSGSGGANSGSGSGSDSSGGSGTIDPITPAPQTSGSSSGGSSGTAGTSAGSATTSPTSPAATGQLPNTGLDTRVLVLAGVVLVLAGVGLRLRNAPERF